MEGKLRLSVCVCVCVRSVASEEPLLLEAQLDVHSLMLPRRRASADERVAS